ncbi:MAG: thioredoxin family protein [Planctomycetota bacterium]
MTPFDDISMFDELRRYTTGAMAPEERAQFEALLRHDPELARLAVEFGEVWSATASGVSPALVSRSRFDEIAPRLGLARVPSAWPRRVAAAAVFLALATGAWFAWHQLRSSADVVVELHAIPWNVPAPLPPENAAAPEVLASWSPVEDGRIRWLDSLDEARAVSAAVSRPIFVFGYVEQCPICQGFLRNEFQDPAILALVDQAVPLRIDLLTLEQQDMQTLVSRRYPLLEMQNDRGEVLHTFGGMFAEVDMQAELARAVAGLALPNWKSVHALGAVLVKARAAEASGHFGEATGSFAALASNRELPKLAEAGTAGLSRVGAVAARLLEDARSSSPADDELAQATFGAGVQQFTGTPFEADLRAVWHAWKESGRFPMLSSPK